MYDYVIVGGGPAGLAFAQCCVALQKKVLIIEKEHTLGGCHRVRRVNGVFTEHGPRIYSTSYKVFNSLLNNMDLNFHDLFTPYNFQMSSIGQQTIWSVISIRELFVLSSYYFRLLFDSKYGQNISMEELMLKFDFSDKTKDIVDRLCRLTDGAGSDRYTVNSFLSLFNQQAFYGIYQPKLPLDKGLFLYWKQFLQNSGFVDFLFDTSVETIAFESKTVTGIIVNDTPTKSKRIIRGNRYIFAIPPTQLATILQRSKALNNIDMKKFDDWASSTKYNDYISLTFHYDKKINLPKVYGFTKSDWGLAFIILSDYMHFDESVSKTVFSITFSYNDRKSRYSNKSVHDCTENELFQDAFLQLKESFPQLPPPTLSILSPGVVRDTQSNTWTSIDTAFMKINTHSFLPFNIGSYINLFTVGTHTGQHHYNFTSLEAAVSNAVALVNKLEIDSHKKFQVIRGWKVSDMIWVIISLFILYKIFKRPTF